MFANLKIRNPSSWTIFIFGILAAILGVVGLARPEILLELMNFDIAERADRADTDYTLVFMTTSSMASFNVGVYYVLASLINLKVFYTWTVPFRILTFTVFTLTVVNGLAPTAFIGVAVWELVGALATGAALYYERKNDIE